MHFDDRLATVLRLRTDSAAVARVQYRQLVDLLGTLPSEARSDQLDAAYVRLARLTALLPASERAAILQEPGLRLRSPRLVSSLSEGEPQVASAVMRKAQLTEEQWLDLIPALPIAARSSVRGRQNLGERIEQLLQRLGIQDRGLPASDGVIIDAEIAPAPLQLGDTSCASGPVTEPAPVADVAKTPAAVVAQPDIAPAPPPAAPPVVADQPAPREGIGALVQRIETYRRAREAAQAEAKEQAARNPEAKAEQASTRAIHAFDFSSDSDGRIVWADASVAPMAVGQAICGSGDEKSSLIEASLRKRQPVRAAQVTLSGAAAIAGEWQVDAAPMFDPSNGRYTGYCGRFRRPVVLAATLTNGPPPETEADRMRELLHELRTPVNAIQGFAEIIQQQLFGPTPHQYRAIAAAIAGDSARILAGFDELDRLARLDTGAAEVESGEADLGGIVQTIVSQIETHTGPRGSGFAVSAGTVPSLIGLAPVEAERISWRLLATLAGNAAPGEKLKLRLGGDAQHVVLTMQLPATLASLNDSELMHASAGNANPALSAGMFGTGFALRLARAEARGAGGRLDSGNGELRLFLPRLAHIEINLAKTALANHIETPESYSKA